MFSHHHLGMTNILVVVHAGSMMQLVLEPLFYLFKFFKRFFHHLCPLSLYDISPFPTQVYMAHTDNKCEMMKRLASPPPEIDQVRAAARGEITLLTLL